MPVPALVVEVVSPAEPTTPNYDRDDIIKRQEYAARGIPEYWLIDLGRGVVIVFQLLNSAYQGQEFRGNAAIASPSIAGLPLTAAQILAAGL